MGCATSKQATEEGGESGKTPSAAAIDHNAVAAKPVRRLLRLKLFGKKKKKKKKEEEEEEEGGGCESESGRVISKAEVGESGRVSCASLGCESVSLRLRNIQRYVEGEQVEAGWPAWLSAVAGEAIQGWVPLRCDSFEKLDKIGHGTYSSVFRARNVETGKIVALKKVRFNNLDPESVRFMAREIKILRKLDHPNVIKLEGLIASRLSCNIYLVFEYMEHDLTGLLGCSMIKFTDSQIKCYMKQLLSGLEHCHSRGIMHRDIKGSNILINNEGVLKVADFGLANSFRSKQPLTSRVVTLWYRPPELLLGATNYGSSVDLWSVGCVFAEIYLKKPILQGRTEVEQIHKIFKLCGSPPEEYWKRSKLPNATLFRPQQQYKSSLSDACKDLPANAVKLIESLLCIEPSKRRTASSALASKYFTTKPHACEPSTLPKYPPNKEMDTKNLKGAIRTKNVGRGCGLETTGAARKPAGTRRLAPAEKIPGAAQGVFKIYGNNAFIIGERDVKVPQNLLEEASRVGNASELDGSLSGSLQLSGSSVFSWAKRRTGYASSGISCRFGSRGLHDKSEASAAINGRSNSDLNSYENREPKGYDSYERPRHAKREQWGELEQPDMHNASYGGQPQELSLVQRKIERMTARGDNLVYRDQGSNVEFSGPLMLSESHVVNKLLERHERHIRQTVRKSRSQRSHEGKKKREVNGSIEIR